MRFTLRTGIVVSAIGDVQRRGVRKSLLPRFAPSREMRKLFAFNPHAIEC